MTTEISPAKINLFLYVTDRRSDGYHELVSLMTTVDLADEICFSFDRTEISVRCDTPGVPEDGSNLAHRAARLFFDRFSQKRGGQSPLGVHMAIEKKIPAGGGLGGGSSNAATVLMALNRHYQDPFSNVELREIGLEIGADIPFFIFGGPALAKGVGDALEPWPDLPFRYLVLCDPGVAASTVRVFKNFDFCLTSDKKYTINTGLNVLSRGIDFDTGQGLHNDLELAACRIYPEIKAAKEEMALLLKRKVFMSGSGSSLFALYRRSETAARGAKQLRAAWSSGERRVFLTSFQNR